MQGAKTSKIMFPCGRRVHLHKSASFKLIFGKFRTNHKNDAKIDTKIIENPFKIHPTNDSEENSKMSSKNTPNFQMFGSHFGAVCFVTCFRNL